MQATRVPDLDSLALLLRIDATGSFGRAATEHGITQPAVSARVRAMEVQVGVPLVARGPRGSVLTPAGIVVAGWARTVLDAAAEFDAGVASLRSVAEHRLRVAASLTVAEFLLPRWLVRLARDRPETAVSLLAMNSSQVADAVRAGTVDLGFVEGPRVAPGLKSRVVARDRLVLIVPVNHPWARRRRPVDAVEIADTRLVQREASSGTRSTTEAQLGAAGPLAVPLLELSTTRAVIAAVAAGAGPALVSELAVVDDLAAGRIRAVSVRGTGFERRLRAVWPRDQRPSEPARELLAIAGRTPAPT